MNFIVFDELGYLSFAQSGGQLLFHLVSRLYDAGLSQTRRRPLAPPRKERRLGEMIGDPALPTV